MADNTPDFDSMSPEELMAWMETLAERQGATEGFVTDQRMDIAEVDPDTVEDTGPGYIPYGMTEEQWAKKQAEEEAVKAARRAQVSPPRQPPPAQPPPPAEPPVAQSAGEPDFDSMSPEELMAWMETLAERQGATEGFTTDQRMDIAEVDPDTVEDTGPGYIPYGMTEEQWAAEQAQQTRQLPQVEDEDEELSDTTVAAAIESDWLQNLTSGDDAQMDLSGLGDEIQEEEALPMMDLSGLDDEIGEDEALPMMDLSGLGDELGEDEILPMMDLSAFGDDVNEDVLDLSALDEDFSGLDLSALGEELTQDEVSQMDFSDFTEEPEDEMAAARDIVNNMFPVHGEDEEIAQSDPMEWLEGLVQDGGEDNFPNSVADPTQDDVDPLEWLESLARQQGTDEAEFITDARVSVPDQGQNTESAYTDYTVESEEMSEIDSLDSPLDQDADDPVAWLESLASSRNADKPPAVMDDLDLEEEPAVEDEEDDANVLDKLSQGISDPDDMRSWMDNLLAEGAARENIPDYVDEDEEEAPLEAQIPDWLVEQVGPPPDMDSVTGDTELPEEVEIPDWLQESVPVDESLADIFVEETPEPTIDFVRDDVEIDPTDPWTEAFEEERQGELADVDTLPDWYTSKLGGEPDTVTATSDGGLTAAAFEPDPVLAHGEAEPVPDWLAGTATVADEVPAFEEEPELVAAEIPDWLKSQVEEDDTLEAVMDGEELPDWLRDVGMETNEPIPDWLMETTEEETPAFTAEEPFPEPVTTPVPEPVVTASPAPVLSDIDTDAVLQSAREKTRIGEIDAALIDYEAVVRANAQLDAVVSDLGDVVKTHKENPVVYRVLGDSLMRKGQLQDALDTYRKALNLL